MAQDELAGGHACLQALMCGSRVLEGVGSIHDRWGYVVVGHELDQASHVGRAAHGAADELELPEVERSDLQLGLVGSVGAEYDTAPARP